MTYIKVSYDSANVHATTPRLVEPGPVPLVVRSPSLQRTTFARRMPVGPRWCSAFWKLQSHLTWLKSRGCGPRLMAEKGRGWLDCWDVYEVFGQVEPSFQIASHNPLLGAGRMPWTPKDWMSLGGLSSTATARLERPSCGPGGLRPAPAWSGLRQPLGCARTGLATSGEALRQLLARMTEAREAPRAEPAVLGPPQLQGCAYLGASFGLTAALLRFWSRVALGWPEGSVPRTGPAAGGPGAGGQSADRRGLGRGPSEPRGLK